MTVMRMKSHNNGRVVWWTTMDTVLYRYQTSLDVDKGWYHHSTIDDTVCCAEKDKKKHDRDDLEAPSDHSEYHTVYRHIRDERRSWNEKINPILWVQKSVACQAVKTSGHMFWGQMKEIILDIHSSYRSVYKEHNVGFIFSYQKHQPRCCSPLSWFTVDAKNRISCFNPTGGLRRKPPKCTHGTYSIFVSTVFTLWMDVSCLWCQTKGALFQWFQGIRINSDFNMLCWPDTDMMSFWTSPRKRLVYNKRGIHRRSVWNWRRFCLSYTTTMRHKTTISRVITR